MSVDFHIHFRAGKKEFRTGGIQDWRDKGKEGYRKGGFSTGGIKEKSDTGKEDSGLEG